MRNPNFSNVLKVLRLEKPSRPTLFEFFLNTKLYNNLAGSDIAAMDDKLAGYRLLVHAFKNAGYDYATVPGSDFLFISGEFEHKASRSINDGTVITDKKSFEAYDWRSPDEYDYSNIEGIAPELPQGMKLIVSGPGGVLENVIGLVGYENLCFMVLDEPGLAQDIFDAVGSRIVRHYELTAPLDPVGALISNDDWGFNTQTMLAPEDMRKYVFPWHKKIVDTIHAWGKPAILHSCGNLDEVMEDIIVDMGYDGKHSYEDNILPVEDAYEEFGNRIAIMGGIDLDFVCRATPQQVYDRSLAMLERASETGGFALGTGNSVPEYVPDKNYFAMIQAATGFDYSQYT